MGEGGAAAAAEAGGKAAGGASPVTKAAAELAAVAWVTTVEAAGAGAIHGSTNATRALRL